MSPVLGFAGHCPILSLLSGLFVAMSPETQMAISHQFPPLFVLSDFILV